MRKKTWLIVVLLIIATAFLLGFMWGQRYVSEDIYRANIPLDYAVHNPDKVIDVFLCHAKLCKLLAKYKPPIDNNEIDTATIEIQQALHRLKEAETSLKENP